MRLIPSALTRVWPRRILALVCLLLAAASALSAHAPAAAGQRTVSVVVTARELPAGRVITSGDLQLARWPTGLPPTGAFTSLAAVAGRRLAGPIARGDVLTTQRLLGATLTAGLPAGAAAVPVTLADPDAASLIRAGDHVDLLVPPANSDGLTDSSGDVASTDVTVVARALLVLAVVPKALDSAGAPAAGGTEIVVAADEPTELVLARVAARSVLATVRNPP